MSRNYPMGTQNFKNLIESNGIYVDKKQNNRQQRMEGLKPSIRSILLKINLLAVVFYGDYLTSTT